MSSRSTFLQTIGGIICLSLLPAAISIVVDPYHIFHKALFEKHGFDDQHLFFHIAGMINNYLDDPAENYTAVAIGASTASGYTQATFNKTLNWGRTLNLSISGSNAQHHCIIAKRVLEDHKQVKHLFMDISFHYAHPDYNIENLDSTLTGEPMPLYLYNESRLDDLRYIFNITTFLTSLDIMRGNVDDFRMDIENDGMWITAAEVEQFFRDYNNKDNIIGSLIPNLIPNPKPALSPSEIDALSFDTIDKRLTPTLMPYCNTDIDIVLSISPRSRYSFASTALNESFYRELYMRRHLASIFSDCRNIRIFAFDNIDAITADLRNYMDDLHFRASVHNYILDAISRNENRINLDNIDDYEAALLEKINAYPAQLRAMYPQQ